MPLDLVDVAEIEALAQRLEVLESRVAQLRTVAEVVATHPIASEGVRDQARAALRMPLAEAGPDAEVVLAWGCPDCGRIDAPQPCLGVCIRRPVLMADAEEYRVLATRTRDVERRERALSALARLVAHVTARPGQEDRVWTALRSRARAATDLP